VERYEEDCQMISYISAEHAISWGSCLTHTRTRALFNGLSYTPAEIVVIGPHVTTKQNLVWLLGRSAVLGDQLNILLAAEINELLSSNYKTLHPGDTALDEAILALRKYALDMTTLSEVQQKVRPIDEEVAQSYSFLTTVARNVEDWSVQSDATWMSACAAVAEASFLACMNTEGNKEEIASNTAIQTWHQIFLLLKSVILGERDLVEEAQQKVLEAEEEPLPETEEDMQPVAIIEVPEEPWYTARKNAGGFGSYHLRRGFAPFPIFLEGWKSTPFSKSTKYEWDFGDGSYKTDAFNAAHVYTSPGTYTITLKVTNRQGEQSYAFTTVEVLAPTRTFYVDADAGSDANDGLTTDRAWRTADFVLGQMGKGKYGPGDRILFKRGQTFLLSNSITPPRWGYRCGYSFGAYGTGDRPIIKRANNGSTASILNFANTGACHIGFQSITFNGTSPDTLIKSSILRNIGGSTNLLFLDCRFEDGYQHVGFNGPSEPGRERVVNGFVVNCTGHNSGSISIYIKARRIAFLNSTWEYSAEQVVYGGWPDRLLMQGNRFAFPSFGKPALRISAASNNFNVPAEYICVQDGDYEGWIDPYIRDGGDGESYNYTLCTIAPNVPDPQLLQHIRWERNNVRNAQTLLQVGACDDVIIQDNTFTAPHPCSAGSARVKIGSEFEERPITSLLMRNNYFYCDETRSNGGSQGAVIGLLRYRHTGRHTGVVLMDNTFEVTNGIPALYWFEGTDAEKYPDCFISSNLVGAAQVRYGGAYNNFASAERYNLGASHTVTDTPPPVSG
jgi:hypothetical protein